MVGVASRATITVFMQKAEKAALVVSAWISRDELRIPLAKHPHSGGGETTDRKSDRPKGELGQNVGNGTRDPKLLDFGVAEPLASAPGQLRLDVCAHTQLRIFLLDCIRCPGRDLAYLPSIAAYVILCSTRRMVRRVITQ